MTSEEVSAKAHARGLAQAEKQRAALRVTLASLSNAVTTTDMDGRVTFLDAVAQELTGQRLNDAQSP